MHLIISAIIALGGLLWAVNRLMSGAAEAHGTVRRLRWKGRHDKDHFSAIDDPRIAAVILLGQLMRYEGDISTADREHLVGIIEKDLRTPGPEAHEIVAQALYLLGQKTDAANDLSKLVSVIQASCSAAERADLLRLMNDVAGRGTEPNDMQTVLIDRTRQRLLD